MASGHYTFNIETAIQYGEVQTVDMRRDKIHVGTYDEPYVMGRLSMRFSTTDKRWLDRVGQTVRVTHGRRDFESWQRVVKVEGIASWDALTTRYEVATEEAPKPKETSMDTKTFKKYYVGKPGTQFTAWAKETEAEAIEHAKGLVERDGQEQIIVKVIAVVKRKTEPVVVQRIK